MHHRDDLRSLLEILGRLHTPREVQTRDDSALVVGNEQGDLELRRRQRCGDRRLQLIDALTRAGADEDRARFETAQQQALGVIREVCTDEYIGYSWAKPTAWPSRSASSTTDSFAPMRARSQLRARLRSEGWS